ncbi:MULTISPECIES: hypothetical protein [Chryseobacterium]|uniref:hypothetical protein n=1 Tax=Chryseobacterium TaxID=59732 RepID=UPI0012966262|nr:MULTISPECIES: hypothetical protein [Chryseobacterium]MDR6920284.1 hypothetical protein [Chryseobacterium sp. 2987]
MSRNQKFLIVFLYLFALSFSFFKTVRLPNKWAIAHWLMDYRFGFIKRGLIGELFGFFFEKNEFNILIISSVILFLLYASLLSIAVRNTWKNYSIEKVLFYVIFFLSQYMILSAHLIGYFDHLIFLMTLLSVYLIGHKKMILASLITVFCIVAHEVSFVLMVPVCLFALLVNEVQDNKLTFNSGLLKKIGLYLLLPVAATVSVSLYQELYGQDNRQLIFNYLKNTELIKKGVANSVAAAYTEGFGSYLKSEAPYFLKRVFLSIGTVKYGVPLLFMAYMVYKKFSRINIYILLLLAVVSVSPLVLHSIAWDTFRIWSFPFIILFTGFWILCGKFQPVHEHGNKLSLFEIVFFLISIALVSMFPNFLFENETERFSTPVRILILIPIFSMVWYLYKKAPEKYNRD